jgi:AAA15 family ATPase/GTPase
MLIRFNIENFSSFNERQTISFLPGKGTLKPEHKTKPVKSISLLKTAVVFGANASGKSNLVRAVEFGRRLVLVGTRPGNKIPYRKFRLDVESEHKDSRIEYEIQHRGKNYAYGFVFNSSEIVEEWLYEVKKSGDVKLFVRDKKQKEPFDLDYFIQKNHTAEEKQFLKFIAKGTPDNQLFLTEIRNRKVKENVSEISDLLNVNDWFLNSLKVIFPDDKYKEGLKFELENDQNLLTTFQEFLDYFDTGISGVCLEKIDRDGLEFPKVMVDDIIEDLQNKESESVVSVISHQNNTYFFCKKDEEVTIQKFMTKHKVKGRTLEEFFDAGDESDGTNRIMDFIPLIMDLLKGDNVFLVDEMERSLHPNLMYDLIDLFIEKAKEVNSQLIIATHESSLLTQKLLRKDEIWFVVKDKDGASKLHSLEEYDIRFDKEIRKDYLLGRYKGVPRIGNRKKLTILPNQS